MPYRLTTIGYRTIPAEDNSDEEGAQPVSKTSKSSDIARLSIWLAVLAVACTIVNGALVLFDRTPTQAVIRRESTGSLPRPNQFMGLDTIEYPVPPISRQFVNYPFLLTQIDSSKPEYIYSDDPKGHMTFRGYVSPEDRHVYVAPMVRVQEITYFGRSGFLTFSQISTVVQFRALDFGMEQCELSILVSSTPEGYNFTLGDDSQDNNIDIWHLATHDPLDAKKLSWSTRPERARKIGTINMEVGTTYSQRFHCSQDSVHTLELACAAQSSSCHIDWWQKREEQLPSIYVTQYSTI